MTDLKDLPREILSERLIRATGAIHKQWLDWELFDNGQCEFRRPPEAVDRMLNPPGAGAAITSTPFVVVIRHKDTFQPTAFAAMADEEKRQVGFLGRGPGQPNIVALGAKDAVSVREKLSEGAKDGFLVEIYSADALRLARQQARELRPLMEAVEAQLAAEKAE